MRIKKVFTLLALSCLSLTICGCKNKEKENKNLFLEGDIVETYSIDHDIYAKSLTKIVEGSNVSIEEDYNSALDQDDLYIIEKTDSEYIFYVPSIKNEPVFKVDSKLYSTFYIDDGFIIFKSELKANESRDILVYYMNGTKILSLENVIDYDYDIEYRNSSLFASKTAEQLFSIEYILVDDSYHKYDDYLVITTENYKGEKTYKYMTLEEYRKSYTGEYIDGKNFGLDGYYLKYYFESTEAYIEILDKNYKLVNIINARNISSNVVSNGFMLYQETEVASKDDFDVYNDSYIKVKTYTLNLLTNEVKEIKDFKYYIDFTSCLEIFTVENDAYNIICYNIKAFNFENDCIYDEDKVKGIFVDALGNIYDTNGIEKMQFHKKDDNSYFAQKNTELYVIDKNGNILDLIPTSSNNSYDKFYLSYFEDVVIAFDYDNKVISNEILSYVNRINNYSFYANDIMDNYYLYVFRNGKLEKYSFSDISLIDGELTDNTDKKYYDYYGNIFVEVNSGTIKLYSLDNMDECLVSFDSFSEYYLNMESRLIVLYDTAGKTAIYQF